MAWCDFKVSYCELMLVVLSLFQSLRKISIEHCPAAVGRFSISVAKEFIHIVISPIDILARRHMLCLLCHSTHCRQMTKHLFYCQPDSDFIVLKTFIAAEGLHKNFCFLHTG